MKNIIVLHGSPRKVNTYSITMQIEKILEELVPDIQMEHIFLGNGNIKECIGCERCILTDCCVLKDEVASILDKIEQADGVILTSPVYLRQVSGQFKTFVDRTCKWFHRPILAEKPVLVVATTKGSGLKSTLSYMEEVGEQWGGMRAGRIGRNIRTIDNDVSRKEVEKFVNLLRNPKIYRPSLKELINFEVQKSLANYVLEQDKEYWSVKDWNHRRYYFVCRINPMKAIGAGLIGDTIRRGMKKNQQR